MTYNGSSSDRTFNIKSTKDGSTDLGTVNAPKNTALTAEQTASLTGTSFKKFYLVPSGAVAFSYIKVTYSKVQASNFCTTVPTATITLSSVCTDGTKYYGTYSNGSAFVVPSDLTVSAISVSKGKLTVSDYATGDVVKANTGVMVSSATSGSHTVTLTAATGTELDGNMLKASGDAGITAAEMDVANTLFYRLTMHNNEDIGFWWGAEDGAAFALAANKAYLAVPQTQARQGFSLFGDESDGIDATFVDNAGKSGEVYNLQGQRVGSPTKGLYIVNGKKVVMK